MDISDVLLYLWRLFWTVCSGKSWRTFQWTKHAEHTCKIVYSSFYSYRSCFNDISLFDTYAQSNKMAKHRNRFVFYSIHVIGWHFFHFRMENVLCFFSLRWKHYYSNNCLASLDLGKDRRFWKNTALIQVGNNSNRTRMFIDYGNGISGILFNWFCAIFPDWDKNWHKKENPKIGTKISNKKLAQKIELRKWHKNRKKKIVTKLYQKFWKIETG